MPIVLEGLPFVFVFLMATVGFAVGGIWEVSVLFGLGTCFIVYFFRNPERLPPVGSAMVAAPADGKIIFVGKVEEQEFTKEVMTKVSIFMSIFDVHVNRVPVDGTVKDIRYFRGRFMVASEEKASEENEHNALLMETGQGAHLVVVQVAGLVARRIVCYPTAGAFILKGQRFGLIRFGSRVDLYLPLSAEVLVKEGEKVLGGETIIAKLDERRADGQD